MKGIMEMVQVAYHVKLALLLQLLPFAILVVLQILFPAHVMKGTLVMVKFACSVKFALHMHKLLDYVQLEVLLTTYYALAMRAIVAMDLIVYLFLQRVFW